MKNGGVTSYDTRIVKPVSRIVGDSVTTGTQVEFRWRSSSSAYHNPRETKLAVKYQVMFGPQVGVNKLAQADITAGATTRCSERSGAVRILSFGCVTASRVTACIASIGVVAMWRG